jgi:hypothetical protein
MHRLEKIVKKHEFKLSVEKNKEEVDHGSGGTVYTAVLGALFVTVSVLVCFKFFLEDVAVMGSSKIFTMEVSEGCSTPLCPASSRAPCTPTTCV